MPKWRQDLKTGKLIPIDKAATRQTGSFVQGDIQPFVSPIDGSVIADRKQYREHCKKHGVVPAAEFSKEFYDRKAAERADHYTGNRSTEERIEIRKAIYEQMIRAERNG